MHIDVGANKGNNKSDTDTDRRRSILSLRPWHKKHNMQHNQSKLNGRHVCKYLLESKLTCWLIQSINVKTHLQKRNSDTDDKTLLSNICC